MSSPWSFRCTSPDFTARSIPDDVLFKVKRQCLLNGSDLFGNMFADCGDQEQNMDLHESAHSLEILFRLLHDPPQKFERAKPTPAKAWGNERSTEAPTSPVIPLPVIPLALGLADKYMLSSDTILVLHSHIAAHVSTQPLKVYALAVRLGLPEVASDASEYLLHPPLSSYRAAEIAEIPTVEALFKLIRLHGMREAELRDVVIKEDVFPHDYGLCSSHGTATKLAWEERKRVLAPRIRAGTDVATEMKDLIDKVGSCKVCEKAATAAVEMLAYKCRKVIRKIHQLPIDE